MTNDEKEAQKKADLDLFENEITNVSKQLPTHEKKEFTFTALEQQMLAEQQTIVVLAKQTQDKIVNEVSLKRIGIQPNPTVHIRYAIGLGRFAIFIPKKM